MRWFGESWGAPINEDVPHAPTPVGEQCEGCHQPVEDGDQGVLIPDAGWVIPVERPFHHRCFLAGILGPHLIAHVAGR